MAVGIGRRQTHIDDGEKVEKSGILCAVTLTPDKALSNCYQDHFSFFSISNASFLHLANES